MQIDEKIEEHVREAYSAVVGRDGNQMAQAFDGLNKDDRNTALALGLFVCEYALNDTYPDGPTESDLLDLAREIVEEESSWINLGTPGDLATFLKSVARGDTSASQVREGDIAGHTFVCGGHLLATRRLKNQRWWEYLDEIWAAAQSMPES